MENEKNTVFGIERIYVKDLSFEIPHAPDIFVGEWKADLDLNLNNTYKKIEESKYEVTLKVNITTKNSSKVAFIIELQQSGIFHIENIPENEINHILSTFCPTILFPYARETISDMVTRGSFPQLLLAPINFDAVYASHLEKEAAETATAIQ